MILPISTNIRTQRTPYLNYILIAVNIIIFFITFHPTRSPFTREIHILRLWAEKYMLHSENPVWYQFVSYAFLHGGWLHLVGNMFFLYLFGRNVNDKLGTVKYLIFYLLGAIASGGGHILIHNLTHSAGDDATLLGASGAIAAVTGAYMVFYPRTIITVLYWFFFIGTIEVSAIFFILFKLVIFDNIIATTTPDVGYDAHLVGYAFGIAGGLLMLLTRLTTTSGFDLLSMIKQANRRRIYRDSIAKGYNPYTGQTAQKTSSRQASKTPEQQQHEEKIFQLRSEISNYISQRNLAEAAKLYLLLNDMDSTQQLPRQQQLDIANQLASENKYEQAAQAYEKFIEKYENYEYIEQVELMLGLIYGRYLKKNEAAVFHLKKAKEKLTDTGQRKMCEDELEKLQN